MVLKVNLRVHEPKALRRGRRLEQLRGLVPAGGLDQRAAAPGRRDAKSNLRGREGDQLTVARPLEELPLGAVHRRPQGLSLGEGQRHVVPPVLDPVYVHVANRVLEILERHARVGAARGVIRDSPSQRR